MITIKRYTPEDRTAWNNFVATSKNGTFLLDRNYMEYHADRFSDYSLIACNDKGKIVALLPANISGTTLFSHQGLTYGGWITQAKHFTVAEMLDVFDAMIAFLKKDGIRTIIYKAIPHIYHRYPAEEDLYALFRHNAKLIISNVSTTIELNNPMAAYRSNTKLNIRKAAKEGLTIEESEDYAPYMQMLTEHLQEKYHTRPVHTAEEIQRLHNLFPKQIRLFTVRKEGRLIAGCVFYITDTVAHMQYSAMNEEGSRLYAVPFLHDYLIRNVFSEKRFYDFGISNEDNGRYLNEGLSFQKTGLGGRAIAYNIYQMDI